MGQHTGNKRSVDSAEVKALIETVGSEYRYRDGEQPVNDGSVPESVKRRMVEEANQRLRRSS